MNIVLMCLPFYSHTIKINFILTLLYNLVGVADGVGGWRRYGIDPGEFSSFLMRTCDRLVKAGKFNCTDPSNLLARSYYELLENKQPILGKFFL